ncbi:MAG: CsgG/HfaB family protein [Neisseriaceae bacterium]|nr:CsgG/HfaB family protein [Neisseriaceae bacterium]MBR3425229.1 CsgG/HfaB family protein [Neisseriaceae bacterium]
MRQSFSLCCLVLSGSLLVGCATESSRVVENPTPISVSRACSANKPAISIGRFNNQSSYNNGIFAGGEDRLGNQAQTLLIADLTQSGCFTMLERSNMSAIAQESKISGQAQNLKGAQYVITGDITEFGRKTTGDQQLFGILGSGKKQTAYAKVNINVVDVATSQVVYTASGAGEYSLSNREIVGFGGTSGYDSTLNGKVLSLAIRNGVNNLINGWKQ